MPRVKKDMESDERAAIERELNLLIEMTLKMESELVNALNNRSEN